MGLTAIGIIYSPWGRQSGALMNPAMTLTFLCLGKIKPWDATLYIAAQFVGGVCIWTSGWIYLTVPVLGMLLAAPVCRAFHGSAHFARPKLYHGAMQRCIFCGFRPAGRGVTSQSCQLYPQPGINRQDSARVGRPPQRVITPPFGFPAWRLGSAQTRPRSSSIKRRMPSRISNSSCRASATVVSDSSFLGATASNPAWDLCK